MNTDSFSSFTTKKQCSCRILFFSGYNDSGHVSNIICTRVCITKLRNNPKANRKVIGSTPVESTRIFFNLSEYDCVTNRKTSYSL